ncbi:hypothetical protein E6B08_20345 [Pseudomonas putida]|uniref:Uncharacterized protein n=1 Tax=Pseudomonas putida TaxID=303 RepID=A0A4D6XL27_PSEPU|nr:hypothetical protein [Pseudomonas putida]QCI13555.1 hypothetical protein E6B08_20345 [Pseudomonas putida]
MSNTLQIKLTSKQRAEVQQMLFTVTSQDWWDDGFKIEAISELQGDEPTYWLRLSGQSEPRQRSYELEDENEDEGLIFVEFGLYGKNVLLIEAGTFEVKDIDFIMQSLEGSFDFPWGYGDQEAQVSCDSFKIRPNPKPAREP